MHVVREEDVQPLAHPHTIQTVTSSARGRGREKTNEILDLEREEGQTEGRKRDRGGIHAGSEAQACDFLIYT